jgi:hypothetical protein
MRVFRTLFLTLLLVSMLPWAAYHGRAQAGAARGMATVIADAQDTAQRINFSDERSTIRPATAVRFKARSTRCRTATLPGAGCGGDQAIMSALPVPGHRERDAVYYPVTTTLHPTRSEAPPRSPPRIG